MEKLLKRLTPPAQVLDVGCGTGRYGRACQAPGFSVVGLDRSLAQLQQAHGLQSTVEGDATQMPFEGEAFDACIAVLMLHQLDSTGQRHCLGECARVLRSEGVLAIKTCSEADLEARPFGEHFPSALALNLRRYPSIDFLKEVLSECGFGAIETEATHTVETVSVEELLRALALKHNSTMALIPPEEVESGVERLRAELEGDRVDIDHRHTLVFGVRE